MRIQSKSEFPRAISLSAALVVSLIGAAVIAGWVFDTSPLNVSLFKGITVKTNTGICLLLAGASLWLTVQRGGWPGRVVIARLLAGVVVAFGALTLSQYVVGWDLGIDQLFFSEPPNQLATASPNRMGPPACICFCLAGISLLLLNKSGPPTVKRMNTVATLGIVTGVLALLPAVGYLYGAEQLYGIARLTGIALPTAIAILIQSTGIISATMGGSLMSLLTSRSTGGMLARRLVWPALILPLALGYIRTVGEDAGFYNAAFGRALLIVSFIVIFVSLVWWSARAVDASDRIRSQATGWLGAIVESSEDAIVGKTLDGTVTSWNQAAERLFGYTAQEMIGQKILRVIPPERQQEEFEILARLKAGERVEHFETVRIDKQGRRLQLSLTISPIKDLSGTIIGASKIARDITSLKERQAEREAILSAEHAARRDAEQASRMKDEFLATLSHELRTPLSAILGWSQLLRSGNMNSEQMQQGLETIQRNARMQTQLIEDLLDMSGIISGKVRLDIQSMDPVAVIEAALQTVTPSAQAKGIRLERIMDPAAGPIYGDPNRLQQVIWNLLSNAIKFTPRDGKVQVVLQRVNSHVEISVADTGAGIKPEFLEHVFERFRQADSSTSRKHGGLGLGLAIVKHLVELHGGTVRANSAGEGMGATFTVALPLTVIRRSAEGPASHPKSPDLAPTDFKHSDLSGLTVLVVDDEPDARDLIRRVLEECEARVLTAATAGEALDVLESQRPNVLVSDIGMPGMDGYELLRQVRALGRARGGRIPAIALTAFARSEDRTRALRAGFLVHVSKPVEPSELVATVASVSGWTEDSATS